MMRRLTITGLLCMAIVAVVVLFFGAPFELGRRAEAQVDFPTYFPTYWSALPNAATPNSDSLIVLEGSTVAKTPANLLANGIRVAVRSSAAATVTMAATDYFLCLDPTSNAIAVTLNASPALGQTFLIKDCTGQASAHQITITPASGNIDNQSNFIMSIPFQSTAVTYTGSQWSIN